MDFTVCVATYGSKDWQYLARSRAIPSVPEGVPVVEAHQGTLHRARNWALDKVRTEFVVFLDADDELEPGYIEAMAAGTADVRTPYVRYVRGARAYPPRVLRVAGHTHDCSGDCLTDGNWMVIGTAVRADTLRSVGGWRDFPWSEDWDAWIRVWRTGATIEVVPDAIYRAHVRQDSRNRGATRAEKLAAHQAIHDANFGAAA